MLSNRCNPFPLFVARALHLEGVPPSRHAARAAHHHHSAYRRQRHCNSLPGVALGLGRLAQALEVLVQRAATAAAAPERVAARVAVPRLLLLPLRALLADAFLLHRPGCVVAVVAAQSGGAARELLPQRSAAVLWAREGALHLEAATLSALAIEARQASPRLLTPSSVGHKEVAARGPSSGGSGTCGTCGTGTSASTRTSTRTCTSTSTSMSRRHDPAVGYA